MKSILFHYVIIFSMLIFLAVLVYGQDQSGQAALDLLTQNTGLSGSGLVGVSSRPGGGAIVDSATSITIENGEKLSEVRRAEIGSNGDIIKVKHLEHQNSVMQNVENVEFLGGESFAADFIELFQGLGVVLQNAFNVRFENGILTADHADSFVKGSSITTNLEKLNSDTAAFSMDSARVS